MKFGNDNNSDNAQLSQQTQSSVSEFAKQLSVVLQAIKMPGLTASELFKATKEPQSQGPQNKNVAP